MAGTQQLDNVPVAHIIAQLTSGLGAERLLGARKVEKKLISTVKSTRVVYEVPFSALHVPRPPV